MALVARLNAGESLGDRIMKVDHAGLWPRLITPIVSLSTELVIRSGMRFRLL